MIGQIRELLDEPQYRDHGCVASGSAPALLLYPGDRFIIMRKCNAEESSDIGDYVASFWGQQFWADHEWLLRATVERP